MDKQKPVFIADTCIGGLSVVRSLWETGVFGNAVFMADYVVNPLGIKSDDEIAVVVERWFAIAQQHSDTLLIACNTLSVRFHQLMRSSFQFSGLKSVVSMVDCFEAMARAEADRLTGKKALVIGTEFTASQGVYPEILAATVPGIQVNTIGATELERRIARFLPVDTDGDTVIDGELRAAIGNTDIAVLACTCFPMVRDRLEALFPGVIFLDPGRYCANLLPHGTDARKLHIKVSGDIVSPSGVVDFARRYLGRDSEISC